MIKNFIFSGAGGQGVLSAGSALARIFMYNDSFVTFCSSYGAEVRGGAVNCEVNISDTEIYCIQNDCVDFLITLNQASFDKYISKVKKNGTVIINSSLVKPNKTRDDISYICVPFSEEAQKLGNIKVANSIALGVLIKLLGNLSIEKVKTVFEKILVNKMDLLQKNIDAFLLGYNYV